MVKKLLFGLLALVVMVSIAFFFRGQASQKGQPQGLVKEKLANCPEKPNCICTEYTSDDQHYAKPIIINKQQFAAASDAIKQVVVQTGGQIIQEQPNYLAATYTSSLFKFVDDVEFRFDHGVDDKVVIHMRSASREGYSDLGVNAKRIAAIKAAFAQIQL